MKKKKLRSLSRYRRGEKTTELHMHEWMWLCKIVYVHIIGSPCEWHSIAFFSTSFGKCVCFFFRYFFFVSFSYSYSYFAVYAIIYSHNVYKTSKLPIPNMNVLICRNLLLNWVLQNCICYTRSYRRFDKTLCHCSGNKFFLFFRSAYQIKIWPWKWKCTFGMNGSYITRAINQTQDLPKEPGYGF